MWRKCDLHIHTTPNEQAAEQTLDAVDLVRRCLDRGLSVVAITDHDHARNVEAVIAAAGEELVVVAGVEVTTDHGHLLAVAPAANGPTVIQELISRAGIGQGSQRNFNEILQIVGQETGPTTGLFRESVVLVGAHVDSPGSLLGPQPLAATGQLELAEKLHALEVVSEERVTEWNRSGVKQSGKRMPLVRGSDAHTASIEDRFVHLYLPSVDHRNLCHAFSLPEASIRYAEVPMGPSHVIETVSFEGGMHNGQTFELSERANALIGPPSSGKSLIVDAIRFVFSLDSDIEEIRDNAIKRLSRSLRDGSVVRVTGHSNGEPFRLERTWGGAQDTDPPFKPIVFSQTELVRRGMDSRPSMALLDVHCPEARGINEQVRRLQASARTLLSDLVGKADRARELAVRVKNPEDGIEATRVGIQALGASEEIARKASEVSRVRSWRSGVSAAVGEWVTEFDPSGGPAIPEIPEVNREILAASDFVPVDTINNAVQAMKESMKDAVEKASRAILDALAAGEGALSLVEAEVSERLAQEGFHEGSEVLTKLESLRHRLVALEQDRSELTRVEGEIAADLEGTRRTIGDASEARLQLREARKSACARVNDSMRTFFVRLDEDAGVEELDRLLEEAKRGTYQQRQKLAEVRESLDRERLLEVAVAHRQGSDIRAAVEFESQDDIARNAVAPERSFMEALALIATTWPEDRLILQTKVPVESFENLTEGMRALAIKEISFAESAIPVVTDQPEDAVPPQNVYENLVPTLREQRSERQFILASHDANIVVAGDMERIHVLRPGDTHVAGTLFDESVRNSAIEILEGGREAFDVRAKRYRDG
jgi:hypothetical protein